MSAVAFWRRFMDPEGAAVFAASVLFGLCGITWGLPSPERLSRLMPPERSQDPALHRAMRDGHAELYQRLESVGRLPVDILERAVTVPPGWTTPPAELMNSYRSYFLRTAHPDEQKTLTYLARMDPRKLDLEPYGIDYGGAFLYPLGAYYASLAGLRVLRLTPDLTVYFSDVRRMARVFLAGRVFGVASFAGCAVFLLLLGRAFGGRAAGLLAAGFFIASPVACSVEHTLNPYGWALLWFLAGCLWLHRYADGGGRRLLFGGAAAVGVCVGSSFAFWPAGLLLAAPLLRRGARRALPEALFQTAAAAAAAGAVFALSNAYFLLRFDHFVGQLLYLTGSFPFRFSLGRMWQFAAEFMPPNMGYLQTALAIAGAAAALSLERAPRMLRLLAAFFFFGYVQTASQIAEDWAHGRHFLIFFAVGSLCAGWLVSEVLRRRSLLAWALAALVLADSGSRMLSYAANFRSEAVGASTRLAASAWLERRLPPGASVGIPIPPQYSETPPFRFEKQEIVLFGEPRQLAGRPLPDFILAARTRTGGAMAPFLKEHYLLAAEFRPRRLFPWAPVSGVYAMNNLEMQVFRKIPDAAAAGSVPPRPARRGTAPAAGGSAGK